MSTCRNLLLIPRWISTCPVRHLRTSPSLSARPPSEPLKHIRAGVYKGTKFRNAGITYEQAQPPEKIGVTKTWNSWNSSSLHEEGRAPETVVEDNFIRSFIDGTFPQLVASPVIIKRRYNQIFITMFLVQAERPRKIYFLVGYTEELLSYFFNCVVKLEIQTVVMKRPDTVFKKI